MKERIRNRLQKIAALTSGKCATCPGVGEYRCCDAMFCEMAEASAKALGYQPVRTGHEIPFMGPKGCTIPPEYRPGCAGFVCGEHLAADRKFAREYRRLHDEISSDPEIVEAMQISSLIAESIVKASKLSPAAIEGIKDGL